MTIPQIQNNTIQQFDYSQNLLRAMLWQYNAAPNLTSLVTQKNTWYDTNQNQFWENWYTNVFNLKIANQFGAVVWGDILDLDLYTANPPSSAPRWGFATEDVNFGFGNWEPQQGYTYNLPLSTQIRALRLRYYQITGSGTVPEINRILKDVFGDLGTSFIIDYNTMSQLYIFNFSVTADLIYLFSNYDILPRPAGVQSSFYDNTLQYFGFAPDSLNFYNGTFYGGIL